MDREEVDRLFGLAFDQAIEAAAVGQTFLAALVTFMVRAQVLTLPHVTDALTAEQKMIEDDRLNGEDPRLRALSLEAFAGSLRRNLSLPPDVQSLLEPWKRDASDPTWPNRPALLPDNDP